MQKTAGFFAYKKVKLFEFSDYYNGSLTSDNWWVLVDKALIIKESIPGDNG
jgi:hypothetical protein